MLPPCYCFILITTVNCIDLLAILLPFTIFIRIQSVQYIWEYKSAVNAIQACAHDKRKFEKIEFSKCSVRRVSKLD